MSISLLFDGNIRKFKEFCNEFFDKNSELKHTEMEMEMLMVAGFVYEFIGEMDMARHYYTKGYEQAKALKKEFYTAVCLSNLGVIDASKENDDLFDYLEQAQNELPEEDQEMNEDNNEEYYEGENEEENEEGNEVEREYYNAPKQNINEEGGEEDREEDN
mmetsp:Transcript_37277/g.38678  ORF Transcript_37277/g.38678 Transcript_37277/m.38678 type:complete len:160 (+) Transcript_37277:86-565(+)